jgi:hypothetical protein
MRFTTRFALLLAPLVSLLCAPAPARAGDYEVGTSLVCDTQAQVERFIAAFNGDAQAAIRDVNTEEQNPSACVIRNVAYMRGFHVGNARNGDNAFEIVRILVVGVKVNSDILPVSPSIHFSLVSVEELAI